MGDYFQHWLDMGRRMTRPPKIFHVNWFRTGEDGKFLWPGYGENLRVIEWIVDRCRGEADAAETPIGRVPTPESLDLTGLELAPGTLEKLLAVETADWREEIGRIGEFFKSFGDRLPRAVQDELAGLQRRLDAPYRVTAPGEGIRPLAAALNKTIRQQNPHVFEMLSPLGRRMYFPKGILAQGAEAKEKAHRYDATIGIAREGGKPMFLPSVMRHFNDLGPAEALTYAPATGRMELREKWGEALVRKNPSLTDKNISTPIITGGVTHALSVVADLFAGEGDLVLTPDQFWENYELIFGVRGRAKMAIYPFFNERGGFHVEALQKSLAARAGIENHCDPQLSK